MRCSLLFLVDHLTIGAGLNLRMDSSNNITSTGEEVLAQQQQQQQHQMPPQQEQEKEETSIMTSMEDIELGVGGTQEMSIDTSPTSSSAALKNKSSSLKQGKHLRWSRIVKTVEVKEANSGLLRGSIASPTPETKAEVKKEGPQMKTILNEVSGSASPGEVLAMMGPSGSGKTSILDVLSGRSNYESGSITLDGEVVTEKVMKKLKKQIAYVKQSDLFFGHLTVRDQLTYTAFLRLPSKWDKSRKLLEVNRIINQLRLNKCADTPIYMISGGEKKRVNIGTELLTDPSIILLDEPTSGLDSTSAVALMRILHTLAQAGKTIITSIHQPSSAVFFGFDKLMLLADGNVVYFGTPNDSLEHVKNLGLQCPNGYNAADHWMDLLVVDSAIEEEENENHEEFEENEDNNNNNTNSSSGVVSPGLMRRRKKALARASITPKTKLIDAWNKDTFADTIDDQVQNDLDTRSNKSGSTSGVDETAIVVEKEKSFNTSWWTQYTVLMHRSMKNSRSAIFTTLNVIKAGAIGLMCGILWFQMPYTESTVFDRSSYYFFTMTFWVFDAMFTAYMAFPQERTIIFKERSSGAYHLSAYFMAKTTSEAPARLVLPAIYMVISYWMSGVNNNVGIFFLSTLCTLLSVLAGESIGLFIGAAVFDMERGMVVMTVASLALMVVGGFFVRNIPTWAAWLSYISPFKYSYNSSVQLVFDRPVPCDGSGVLASCEGNDYGYATVGEVINFLGIEGSPAFNAGLLLVIFFILRVGAFYALKSKKAGERM